MDFVSDSSSIAPSTSCCSAVSTIQNQYPQCICQLEQAFSNPIVATSFGVSNNGVTRAFGIPELCSIIIDFNECLVLLQPKPISTPTHSPIATPHQPPTSEAY